MQCLCAFVSFQLNDNEKEEGVDLPLAEISIEVDFLFVMHSFLDRRASYYEP